MIRPSVRAVLWFFLLAFLIAWGSWIPALHWRSLPTAIPLVGLFAPAIAAIVVGRRAGFADILARVRRWRLPLRLYLAAGLLMPAAYTAAVVLAHWTGGLELRALWMGSSPAFLLASLAWLVFLTSGEEIGWRGFALPELLRLGLSPLGASLVLGLVWGLWHLPLYWSSGAPAMPYPLFLALTMGQSLVYTGLHQRSGGSLLPAILLHATTDFGARLFHIDLFSRTTWALIDVIVLIAGVCVLRRAQGSSAPPIA